MSKLKTNAQVKKLLSLAKALGDSKAQGLLHDWYTVGLWNYCYGSFTGDHVRTDITCNATHTKFWLDPAKVWNLGTVDVESLYPDGLKNGLNIYHKAAIWQYYGFMVAIICTIIGLLVGISAIFSRIGSFFTTFVIFIATLFTVAIAVTTTVMYPILVSAVNRELKDLEVTASKGTRVLAIIWIAAAFMLGAFVFWMFSICCCSGRSPFANNKNRRNKGAEKDTTGYERMPMDNIPMGNPHINQEPYEPYRGQHV